MITIMTCYGYVLFELWKYVDWKSVPFYWGKMIFVYIPILFLIDNFVKQMCAAK